MELNSVSEAILHEVSDWDSIFDGAYSIRQDGNCVSFKSSENIRIVPKEGKEGIDIYISNKTRGEKVYIPACVTKSSIDDLVYNDFHVQSGADVVIVAGCGVHTDTNEGARHHGIHRFFLEAGSAVLYQEKHVGIKSEMKSLRVGKRVIDPVTEVFLGEGATLTMETLQLGGVDETTRTTKAELDKRARLIIHESLLTDDSDVATTDFYVEMNGEDSVVDLVSRSVAKGNSRQSYTSVIEGNCRCKGHSECDAILADNGKVNARPALNANHLDASLIHEAAIGKIAGEQITKLMTLGLTEEEAEERIIVGFLGA